MQIEHSKTERQCSFQEIKSINGFCITDIILGKGSTAEVRLCSHINKPNEFFAVKIILRRLELSKNIFDEEMKREIKILRKLSHPNIVKMIEVVTTPNHIYLFFEYCNGVSLNEYLIKNNGILSIKEGFNIFEQICCAFEVLTKENIVHRDIKPENIMFHDGIIKIVDFGFARIMEKTDPNYYTILGTPAYMSPQIIKGEPYSYKCDIWSSAILLFKLLTGYHPFIPTNVPVKNVTFNNIFEMIYKGFNNLGLIQDERIIYILKNMLEIEENKRWGWQEVISSTRNFVNSLNCNVEKEINLNCKKDNEENTKSIDVINLLKYERKIGLIYKRIARNFYDLKNCSKIKIEENINIMIFYLLIDLSFLSFERIFMTLENKTIFENIVSNNILQWDCFCKTDIYKKFKTELICEIEKAKIFILDLENKVILKLSSKNKKIKFVEDFYELLINKSFTDFNTAFKYLNDAIDHFNEFYLNELENHEQQLLITLKLLQIVPNLYDLFKWNDKKKDIEIEFEEFINYISKISKETIIKMIIEKINIFN